MTRVRTCVIAVVVSLAITATLAAEPRQEPTGFQRVPFGSLESAVTDAYSGAYCGDTRGKAGERTRLAKTHSGDVPVSVGFLLQGQPPVVHIVRLTFAPDKYDVIRSAFVDRYGPPTDTKETTVSTRTGVKYTNETLTWSGPNTFMRVVRYNDKVNEGAAFIGTRASFELHRERSTEERKRAKDDL